MQDRPYIVIEGVIGVGKTTLVNMMSARTNSHVVLEQHDENPFLADFYREPRRYAFQTELFFLLSRYRQQMDELRQSDLFADTVISDYLFGKSRVFASITLEERELGLFNTVAGLLERDIPNPDLVVYLQSDPQRLMHNIRLRNRDYERSMNPEYIEALVEAYNHHFFRYKASDLLIVNATSLDFVHNPEQFEALLHQIQRAPEGVSFYNPSTGSL